MRKVEVVPHNQKWRTAFAVESERVAAEMGENVIAVHHIGSTAIPGIYAKPIIDLLVEVKNIFNVDEQNSSMESIGYEVMGEFGIPGRRYFSKNNQAGFRTHHIHIFEVGSEQVKRHLKFRDYMIAHADDAQKYSEIKRKLAKKYPTNIDKYMDGKDQFIREIDRKAAQWHKTQKSQLSITQ
ncbi:GrpB family protein [Synechocystis sp. LEGE 06083]|uniref:GrpB family protein n=1 Tax=Synechocystis sp. LEGE 06083 TaxID=915336 RepID=UPI00187F2A74|nr:GrpB family protein [Synechocystis sp. LEGE 06083]MBE9195794.1 GrpB family protein [Synechocystis sp. LEGE 06083]